MIEGINPYMKSFPRYPVSRELNIFWNKLLDSTTANLFTVTAKSSGTFVAGSAGDGGYALASGAATTDDSGTNALTVLAILGLKTTTVVKWMQKLRFSEATQSELYFGFFSQSDTDISGGVTNGIYLRKADGSTSLELVNEKATVETAVTIATIAADTDIDVSIEIVMVSATKAIINAYVNGVFAGSLGSTTGGIAVAIQSDEVLRFGLEFMSGDATGTRTLRVYPTFIEIINPI